MKTPVVGVILIAAQALTIAFLVLALLAPDYHKEALIIPGGNSLMFSLSLFSVKCASSCLPFFAGLPSAAMSQHNQAYIRVCQSLVQSMNQKSLQEVTHFLCGVSIAFYGLPETGCTAFQAVSSGSLFLIWFLGMGIVCAVFSLCSLVGFFGFAPTLLMRRSVIGSQLSTAIFVTCGALMYILIGGCLSPSLLAGAFFGTNVSHGFHWSFSAGLAVLLAAMTWTWVVPLWSIWAIKYKYVMDYVSPTSWMEDEARSLINDIRQEAQQFHVSSSSAAKPVSAPPPYHCPQPCASPPPPPYHYYSYGPTVPHR